MSFLVRRSSVSNVFFPNQIEVSKLSFGFVKIIIWIRQIANLYLLLSSFSFFILLQSQTKYFPPPKIFFFSSEDYIFSFVKFSLLFLFLLHTSFPPQTKYVPSPNIFLLFPSALSSPPRTKYLPSLPSLFFYPQWTVYFCFPDDSLPFLLRHSPSFLLSTLHNKDQTINKRFAQFT